MIYCAKLFIQEDSQLHRPIYWIFTQSRLYLNSTEFTFTFNLLKLCLLFATLGTTRNSGKARLCDIFEELSSGSISWNSVIWDMKVMSEEHYSELAQVLLE